MFRVVFQVIGDLCRRKFREPLPHQGCHAGDVGSRLAGAAESCAVIFQRHQRRFPAVRPHDIGFETFIRGRTAAAERLNGVHIVPRAAPTANRPGLALSAGLVILPLRV